jgi:hypothetical protein
MEYINLVLKSFIVIMHKHIYGMSQSKIKLYCCSVIFITVKSKEINTIFRYLLRTSPILEVNSESVKE